MKTITKTVIESEQEAIEIAIELWSDMAVTGERDKSGWSGWAKYGEMRNSCPLCEYVSRQGAFDAEDIAPSNTTCDRCPLAKSLDGTIATCESHSDSMYGVWAYAGTPESRRVAAGRFVSQLKALLKPKTEHIPSDYRFVCGLTGYENVGVDVYQDPELGYKHQSLVLRMDSREIARIRVSSKKLYIYCNGTSTKIMLDGSEVDA